MNYDFILVGQGLAGSILSLTLLKAGYTVCVIDDPDLSSCSSVAAGIWNPVVFKRLTRSWLAEALVPELLQFYKEAESTLGTRLIEERAIIKSFTEEQEQALWMKKALEDASFLDPQLYQDLQITAVDLIPAYSKVKQAGNLHVKPFLASTQAYLLKRQSYLQEQFDHAALRSDDGILSYKHLRATRIVFCEGHLISRNPLFKEIAIKPAKGEVLTIRCEGLLLTRDILNKGIFILPLGDQLYKVGATYQWEQLNDLPTQAAKEELLAKLKALIHVPFEVVAHEAGVRPAVIDRRPVIGEHPQHKHHYVFNGFGTKAVMLAPFFAKQLLNFIQHAEPLDKEISASRFYKI